MLQLLLEVEILREIGAIPRTVRPRVRLTIVIELLFLLSRRILFTTLSFGALTGVVVMVVLPAFVVMVMIVAADHACVASLVLALSGGC